jgi:hypothetical protein
MTLNDYVAIPRDDRHTLLLYGNMIEVPRPGAKRNHALNYLGVMLDRWIRHCTKGDLCFGIDMVLDEAKVLVHAPDLLFLAAAHKRRFKKGRLHGPADLCIDIFEGPQPNYVACRKYADYQCYGVP